MSQTRRARRKTGRRSKVSRTLVDLGTLCKVRPTPANIERNHGADKRCAISRRLVYRAPMLFPVSTNDPNAVQAAVQTVYLELFPGGDRLFVPRAFGWVIECFTGHYADYQ